MSRPLEAALLAGRLSCGAILSTHSRSLLQGGNPLPAAQQWSRLGGPNRTSSSASTITEIVLPLGVAAGQYPGTDGIGQLLPNDLQTVLRLLDLSGE